MIKIVIIIQLIIFVSCTINPKKYMENCNTQMADKNLLSDDAVSTSLNVSIVPLNYIENNDNIKSNHIEIPSLINIESISSDFMPENDVMLNNDYNNLYYLGNTTNLPSSLIDKSNKNNSPSIPRLNINDSDKFDTKNLSLKYSYINEKNPTPISTSTSTNDTWFTNPNSLNINSNRDCNIPIPSENKFEGIKSRSEKPINNNNNYNLKCNKYSSNDFLAIPMKEEEEMYENSINTALNKDPNNITLGIVERVRKLENEELKIGSLKILMDNRSGNVTDSIIKIGIKNLKPFDNMSEDPPFVNYKQAMRMDENKVNFYNYSRSRVNSLSHEKKYTEEKMDNAFLELNLKPEMYSTTAVSRNKGTIKIERYPLKNLSSICCKDLFYKIKCYICYFNFHILCCCNYTCRFYTCSKCCGDNYLSSQ